MYYKKHTQCNHSVLFKTGNYRCSALLPKLLSGIYTIFVLCGEKGDTGYHSNIHVLEQKGHFGIVVTRQQNVCGQD